MTPTAWTPPLYLHDRTDLCRLTLAGITSGTGPTLQEAANDLLVRVYDIAIAVRDGTIRPTSQTATLTTQTWKFLWEIGDIAGRGGDIRARVFGDGWRG